MDLYTLGPDFLKNEAVDEFTSAIWTERYSSAGDVELVVPPTPAMINKLAEGTFLGLDGSDEVMLLDTQSIEDGLLTVKGATLLGFLQERIIRTSAEHTIKTWNMSGDSPGEIIAEIVNQMVILGAGPAPESARAVIPNLSLGPVNTFGMNVTVAVPFGPLYEAITALAETYQTGISLYLDSASDAGYSLKFKTYRGLRRTSDQVTNDIVRFSPADETLADVKELRSIAGYRTVAYAYAPSAPAWMSGGGGTAAFYVDPGSDSTPGWHRRVMMIFVDDIDTEALELMDPGDAIALLHDFLIQKARDALANNNYTRVVDGEVVPQNMYRFGEHYNLGDIIELQGHSDLVQKARVTEFIRSQDSAGERAYPTVSVMTDEEIDAWNTDTD